MYGPESTFFLPKPACFAFRFHQCKNVPLTHRSLDVAHDQTILVVEELHTDLSNLSRSNNRRQFLEPRMQWGCLCRNAFQRSTHLSTRSCASKHLHHDRKFHGLILHHGVHPVSMRLQPRPPDVPRSRPSFLASAFVRANAFDPARITNVMFASCRRKAHETGEVAVVAASSPSRSSPKTLPCQT